VSAKHDLQAARAVETVGSCILLFGLVVLGYQTLHWLHDGFWSPLALLFVWHSLGGGDLAALPYAWLRTLAPIVLACPLSAALIVLGCLVAWRGKAGAADAAVRYEAEKLH